MALRCFLSSTTGECYGKAPLEGWGHFSCFFESRFFESKNTSFFVFLVFLFFFVLSFGLLRFFPPRLPKQNPSFLFRWRFFSVFVL